MGSKHLPWSSLAMVTSCAFLLVASGFGFQISHNARFRSKSHYASQTADRSKRREHPSMITPNGYGTPEGYSRTLNKNGVLKRIFGPRRIDPGRAHLLDASRMMGSNGKLGRHAKQPGTLILIRNGEADCNQTFTGWSDPDLTPRGTREVEHAARLIREAGYEIDIVFTSRLKRAIHSSWAILRELDEIYLPVFKSWRLNGRSYGALTGLSKAEVAQSMGPEVVQQWRTDPNAVPPEIFPSDPRWPGKERKFGDLGVDKIPCSESLSDCIARVGPLWELKIKRELEIGHNVLVVGHGATICGLIKHVQGMEDEVALHVKIPPGSPIIYNFDTRMNPIVSDGHRKPQDSVMGSFLEQPGRLELALEREEEWKRSVPGYNLTMARDNRPMTSLERSLSKLQAERELEDWVQVDKDVYADENSVDLDQINGENASMRYALNKQAWITSHPCLASLPKPGDFPDNLQLPSRKSASIVMIRHGKTEHNKLGLFTGWEDPPLAAEGVNEAKNAGKLLKRHGFEFDVVYTSWLSRAIETAWYMMDELDCTWLPIVKSWRLNERMYGDLTGKSKKMVARRFGEAQLKKWRRGYKIRPPPVNSFSPDYPGNDRRYVKFLTDVRYSIGESIIRSIEKRKPALSRKYPKTESLQDCMRRTIPYFVDNILPEAVDKGKRVLIASSENAIRGLLMHLCNIPEDMIADLNIPNGVPIIFDVRTKSVKLLGNGISDSFTYDFGPAAEYLFQSSDDVAQDEECDISSLSEEAWETLRSIFPPSDFPLVPQEESLEYII